MYLKHLHPGITQKQSVNNSDYNKHTLFLSREPVYYTVSVTKENVNRIIIVILIYLKKKLS